MQHYNIVMALWPYLIDVHNSCMWNVLDYLIFKENFLCRFFSCILPICDYYHACLGGCLAETLLSDFYSHHCLGFSVFHHNLCLAGGNAFVKQHIYHFIRTWFQGEFEQGMIARDLFPCCLMETNLSFIPIPFFRHGASQIQICFSCCGRECSLLHSREYILMKLAEFTLFHEWRAKLFLNSKTLLPSPTTFTVGCGKINYRQISAPSKKVITNLLVASVTSSHL